MADYDYSVRIMGVDADDDDLELDMGPITGAWWDVPLPRCPDCQGQIVWAEAGNVPGTRRCSGRQDGDEGCGSMFEVTTRDDCAWLQRSRYV